MNIYEIDPLTDARWGPLLERHPRASVFHTTGWLEALRRTYGYNPIVYTTTPPTAELVSGTVFCRIESWLTGRRLVSLPFADHSEPLIENSEEFLELLDFLQSTTKKHNWKYIEIRPESFGSTCGFGFGQNGTFYGHKLDLRPRADELFRSFHKKSVQAHIRRAEREPLAYEEGRSEALLDKFYGLLLLTRRRHQLPPQPRDWFRNLIECLGEKIKIRVASKEGRPVASILTLSYKRCSTYKYGCSDARFHSLGGVPLLLWKAIQEAKVQGLQEFDFGRSDINNTGLVRFKDGWAATRTTLAYLRYPAGSSQVTDEVCWMRLAKRVFAHTPEGFLTVAGKLLYRHIG